MVVRLNAIAVLAGIFLLIIDFSIGSPNHWYSIRTNKRSTDYNHLRNLNGESVRESDIREISAITSINTKKPNNITHNSVNTKLPNIQVNTEQFNNLNISTVKLSAPLLPSRFLFSPKLSTRKETNSNINDFFRTKNGEQFNKKMNLAQFLPSTEIASQNVFLPENRVSPETKNQFLFGTSATQHRNKKNSNLITNNYLQQSNQLTATPEQLSNGQHPVKVADMRQNGYLNAAIGPGQLADNRNSLKYFNYDQNGAEHNSNFNSGNDYSQQNQPFPISPTNKITNTFGSFPQESYQQNIPSERFYSANNAQISIQNGNTNNLNTKIQDEFVQPQNMVYFTKSEPQETTLNALKLFSNRTAASDLITGATATPFSSIDTSSEFCNKFHSSSAISENNSGFRDAGISNNYQAQYNDYGSIAYQAQSFDQDQQRNQNSFQNTASNLDTSVSNNGDFQYGGENNRYSNANSYSDYLPPSRLNAENDYSTDVNSGNSFNHPTNHDGRALENYITSTSDNRDVSKPDFSDTTGDRLNDESFTESNIDDSDLDMSHSGNLGHSINHGKLDDPVGLYGHFDGNIENGASSDFLSPFNGNSNNDQDKDDSTIPAQYEFNYDVKDSSGAEFGHKEIRDGSTAKGSYNVILPDGRKQIVEYSANEDGYHPVIRYEESQRSDIGPNGFNSQGHQNRNTIDSTDKSNLINENNFNSATYDPLNPPELNYNYQPNFQNGNNNLAIPSNDQSSEKDSYNY